VEEGGFRTVQKLAANMSENYENAVRKQEEVRQKYLQSQEKVKNYCNEAKYLRHRTKMLCCSQLSLTVKLALMQR
jgi:hypothetical protein